MSFKNVTDLSTGQTAEVSFSAEELAEFEHYRNVVAPVLAQEALRRKRNQLLAETDYLALADVTLTDEMRAYRQALRDLPANTADNPKLSFTLIELTSILSFLVYIASLNSGPPPA